MTTGPQHYREAETLLDDVISGGYIDSAPESANAIAAAQVHATLALAAATIEVSNGPERAWIGGDWREVLS